MSKQVAKKVALLGNPNCGKSTLFNALTGLKQNTANFPGATVERKTGKVTISHGLTGEQQAIHLIDLPGTYSIHPASPDEKIAVQTIMDPANADFPDLVLVVVDATNLKRGLFLTTQIIDQGLPVVVALNMMDLAERRGLAIDISKLESELGVRVIPISARSGFGIDHLKKLLSDPISTPGKRFLRESNGISEEQVAQERYLRLGVLISKVLQAKQKKDEDIFTSRTDAFLTHKVWGYVFFLFVLFLLFEAVFFLSAYPMQWIEGLFILISGWSAAHLPPGDLSDLLMNGVLAGISGVAVFIPQIAALFFFIAVLEDTGYMARVSFIMDKLMRRFGLNGRSIIPLLSGVACAVPAIMGARSIGNWKERLVTVLVLPLMSCSARLPVYTLLISLVVPSDMVFGFFNLQGLTLFGLYLLGFGAAMASAMLFKYFIKSEERSYFIMELPPYRSPKWGSVLLTILDRVKIFLWDAGKIIVAISILLWFLASHGPSERMNAVEQQYAQLPHADSLINGVSRSAAMLEASYAGIIGKSIEPAIAPLGFDWKVGIALVTSFAAREVFVGTMATIHSVGDENNELSIREKMQAEINPITGKKKYSFAMGLSLMLFYAFAMQCMSTMAVVKRETGSWKWPLMQFVYFGLLAYLSAYLAFNLLS